MRPIELFSIPPPLAMMMPLIAEPSTLKPRANRTI
jgi:hypothetical protein